ncbi:MAG: S8 family serine peptidase [Clostridia bacterium]|nr:S8 family serine peptidase [Clostridia bacterium]
MRNKCFLLVQLVSVLLVFILLSMATGRVDRADASPKDAMSDTASIFSGEDIFDLQSLAERYFSGLSSVGNSIDPDEKVWAIVTLSDKSLVDLMGETTSVALVEYLRTAEGISAEKKIIAKQKLFMETLSSNGIEAEYKYSYTTLTNGLAVKLRYGDLDKVRKLGGVLSVGISEEYSLPEDTDESNIAEIKVSLNANNSQFDGSGMVIAVIDTGLDYKHEAFSVMPTSAKITKNDIEAVIGKTVAQNGYQLEINDELMEIGFSDYPLTADMVYINEKVPFAYDYADADTDVMPTQAAIDAQSGSHGTHVAGIAAGNNGKDFFGVAPNAQLAILKTFGDSGGASSIDVLAALQDALILGVDSINMSLGLPCGFASDYYPDVYYNALHEAGISVCCSAGNSSQAYYASLSGNKPKVSNVDYAVLGSSASYPSTFAVASMNTVSRKSYYFMSGSDKITYTPTPNRDFVAELYALTDLSELEYKTAGKGMPEDFVGDYSGKIALIQRGGLNFEDKVANAADAGAIACVIYDNVDGDPVNMSIQETRIPALFISKKSGELLLASSDMQLTFSKDFVSELSLEMSNFSSWGPVCDLSLKPEITAFGGDILSSVPYGDKYELMSGTSMSTPAVAGYVAVVKQYLRTFCDVDAYELNLLVYKLLMSTATISCEPDGTPYSPRIQGAGLVDLDGALSTTAYINVVGQDKTKIELGDDKERTGIYEMKYSIVNFGSEVLHFDLSSIILCEGTDDGIYCSLSAHELSPETVYYVNGEASDAGAVTVNGGETVEIRVIVKLSDSDREYLSMFPYGNYIDGWLVSKGVECESLSVPFLAFYGDWNEAPMLDSSVYDDEDGVLYESMWVGLMPDGQTLVQMGKYPFLLPEGYEEPKAIAEKVAIASFSASYGIQSIYTLFLGLLRNAELVEYEIRDVDTGEVFLSLGVLNCRKASFRDNYGQVVPHYYELIWETDQAETRIGAEVFGLPGNTHAEAVVTAYRLLDEEEGASNNNTLTTRMDIDLQAPTVLIDGTNYRYADGRMYLDLNIFDENFAMSYYLAIISNGIVYDVFDMYPIYNDVRNSSTYVSIDITDYVDLLVSGAYFGLITYDYALNSSLLYIQLPRYQLLNEAKNLQVRNAEFAKTEYKLGLGNTFDIIPDIYPLICEEVHNISYYYTCEDDSVFTSDNGVLTAKAIGRAEVTCYVMYTYEGRVQVIETNTIAEVMPRPDGVRFEKDNYTMVPNVGAYLEPVWINGWASLSRSEFTSSNPEVVEAHDGGMLSRKIGSATISGTFYFINEFGEEIGLSATTKVEVHDGIAVNGNPIIPTGLDVNVTINELSFKADNNPYNAVITDPDCKVGDSIVLDINAIPWFANKTATIEQVSGYVGDYVVNGNKILINRVDSCAFVIQSNVDEDVYVFFMIQISDPDNYVADEYRSGNRLSVSSISLSKFDELGFTLPRYSRSLAEIVADSQASFDPEEAVRMYNQQGISTVPVINETYPNDNIIGAEGTGTILLDDTGTVVLKWIRADETVEHLYIPEGVTTIGEKAFYYAKGLLNVHMPSTLKYIESGAFMINSSIEHIYGIPSCIEYIGDYAFYGARVLTIEMPKETDGPFVIGEYGVWNTLLTEFHLPIGTVSLGERAFYMNFEMIGDVFTLPDTVKYVGSHCFTYCKWNCYALPSQIEYIGQAAFALMYDHFNIPELVFPESCTHVGPAAFVRGHINKIYIGKTLRDIPFGNSLINEYATFEIDPEHPDYVYVDGMVINKSTHTLVYVQEVFNDEVIIPYGITRIDDGVLSWKANANTVHVPETVARIGADALVNCKKIYFYGKKAPTLELGLFGLSYTNFYWKTTLYYFDGEGYDDPAYSCADFMMVNMKLAPPVKLSMQELYGVEYFCVTDNGDGTVVLDLTARMFSQIYTLYRSVNGSEFEVVASDLRGSYIDSVHYGDTYRYYAEARNGSPYATTYTYSASDIVTVVPVSIAADRVIEIIEKLQITSVADIGKLSDAQLAYNSLSQMDKDCVTNIDKLYEAERILKAYQLNDTFLNIDSDGVALRARARYDALDEDMKKYIYNYPLLAEYEKQMALRAAEEVARIERETAQTEALEEQQKLIDELNQTKDKLQVELDKPRAYVTCGTVRGLDGFGGGGAVILTLALIFACLLVVRRKNGKTDIGSKR